MNQVTKARPPAEEGNAVDVLLVEVDHLGAELGHGRQQRVQQHQGVLAQQRARAERECQNVIT